MYEATRSQLYNRPLVDDCISRGPTIDDESCIKDQIIQASPRSNDSSSSSKYFLGAEKPQDTSTKQSSNDVIYVEGPNGAISKNTERSSNDLGDDRLGGQESPPSSKKTRKLSKESILNFKEWIIDEGNNFDRTHEFMLSYCGYIRNRLGVCLDRFFIVYIDYEADTAYYLKWESTAPEKIVAKTLINISRSKTQFGSDAPFNRLLDGEEAVRLLSADHSIPADCNWFVEESYTDYFALPMKTRSRVAGACAWSTKDANGFSENHVDMFRACIKPLTVTLRNLFNEKIIRKLVHDSVDQSSEKHGRNSMHQIAMISHEIRTPLSCIVAMSKLLLDDSPLNEEQKEYMEVITKSGDLLVCIVNDVLDYAKLDKLTRESGNRMDKDMFVIKPNRLSDITKAVTRAIEMQCTGRKISVETTLLGEAANPDLVVHTDGNRVQQILYNLMGNAVKFSPEGGTIIFITEVSEGKLKFTVKDYGKGIPLENLSTIFEPYTQVKSADDTEYTTTGGTGLGLTLTKMLTTGLGGCIHADSVLGEWSKFEVELPLKFENNSEKPAEVASPTQVKCRPLASEFMTLDDGRPTINRSKSLEKVCLRPPLLASLSRDELGEYPSLRLLVADDNIVNQKILTRLLEKLKIVDIDTVSNGCDAVELAIEHTYDVILMDVEMPKMNGIKAAQEVLSRSRHPPKIAFSTAHTSLDVYSGDLGDLLSIPLISKPFDLKQIDSILQMLLSASP